MPADQMTPEVKFSLRIAAALFFILGLSIVFIPRQLCALLEAMPGGLFPKSVTRIDEMEGQFGAIVGWFYSYIGVLYFGLSGSMAFARFSVFSRGIVVPSSLGLLVLAGKIPWQVLLFALLDVGTGAWTHSVLAIADEQAAMAHLRRRTA